jgi:hypothetical protein
MPPKKSRAAKSKVVGEVVSSVPVLESPVEDTPIKTKSKAKPLEESVTVSKGKSTKTKKLEAVSASSPIPKSLRVMLNKPGRSSVEFDIETMGVTSQNQGILVCANIDARDSKTGEENVKIIQTLVEPAGKNLVVFFYKPNYDTLKIYKTWNDSTAVSKLRNYLYKNLFKSPDKGMVVAIESAGYSANDKIQMIIIDRDYLNNAGTATTFLTETFKCYDLFGRKNGLQRIMLKQSGNETLSAEAKSALVSVIDSSGRKGGKSRNRTYKNKRSINNTKYK